MRYAFFPYCFTLAFLLSVLSHNAFATHIYGAEITAAVISCGDFTYKITFTVYENAGSDVQFGDGFISLGEGNPIPVDFWRDFKRVMHPYGDSFDYRIATLEIEHTFPGPGEYLLYMREFNRSPDIVNMMNSVNTPFYTETKLIIDPSIGCNHTPLLSQDLKLTTYTQSPYVQLLNATDPDGDSLSFAFVTPKQHVNREVNHYYSPESFDISFIEGATAADGVSKPTFTVNQKEMVWDAPNVGGHFTYALQVKEWRKVDGVWTNIGYMTRDMAIMVEDTINHTYGSINFPGETAERPDIVLYPNPTSDRATLEINDELWQGGTVFVYNVLGQLMTRSTVEADEFEIDLSAWSEGVYLVILQNNVAQKVLRLGKK